MNKWIEQSNILTAQIYAQTYLIILIKSNIALIKILNLNL
jgi:hypothetical protein